MTGFIGRYLAESLVEQGHDVTGTMFPPIDNPLSSRVKRNIATKLIDIRDGPMVNGLVESTRPEIVYHLAGQAYVIPSYQNAELTFNVNVVGTIHVLEAIRRYSPDASVAVASSGAAYGLPKSLPIQEDHSLEPLSPYGVSKAAQDMLSFQYHANFGLKTYRLRLFATTGPGKLGDAPNDFASQIASAESNGPTLVRVGNLSTSRDISDVRDVVQAMQTVVERGDPGEAYNVGRGVPIAIRDILDKLLALSTAKIEIENDMGRMRPSDEPTLYPDIAKIRKLGWTPRITIDQTLAELLEYWRSNPQPIISMAEAQ